MNHDNHSGWWGATIAFLFWFAGHITLSNIALTVSICVGLLQGYKTLRDIWRDRK